MKTKQFVNKYINELEHFFIPGLGAWPIKAVKSHKDLCKIMPCLKVKDGLLVLNKKIKPNPEVLLELYKYKYEELEQRYEELEQRYEELYSEIKNIAEGY